MNIQIFIPESYAAERKYTLDILCKRLLEQETVYRYHSKEEYLFVLPNGKELCIKDAFFSKYPEGYLTPDALPPTFFNVHNEFTPEPEMPVLFGDDSYSEDENGISIGHDIIASAYFFLSRWEESVLQEKDELGRCDEAAVFAVKHSLIQRALVDEYAAYLRNIFAKSDFETFRKREFRFCATHDIDLVLKWPAKKYLAKTLSGDILKRRSLPTFIKNIKLALAGNDPYDTYGILNDFAEQYNIDSAYYFLVNGYNRPILQSAFGKELFKTLKAQGHTIGIHPDLGSCNNAEAVAAQKEELEILSGLPVTESRQHYLQFQVPDLWQTLSGAGIKTDSSMYFMKSAGFRTGTCSEHPVFDFLQSRQLTIIEKPINFMEQTFHCHDNSEEVFASCSRMVETCKKYKGTFTLLWHNSNLRDTGWHRLSYYYEQLLKLS